MTRARKPTDEPAGARDGLPGVRLRRVTGGSEVARGLRLIAGVVLIIQSWVMFAFVEVPYIRVEPGSATNVLDLISADGAEEYPASGRLLFLTVSLSQRVTPAEAVRAWLDDDVDLVEEKVFTGDLSREELTRINLARMRESQVTAVKVALDHLGYDIGIIGGGALVIDVLADWPAAGRLEDGDLIVRVGDEDIVYTDDVKRAIEAHEPGDVLDVVVERDDERVAVEVPTAVSEDGRTQIGVLLEETADYEFPIDVSIDTGRVGGPSAGLAFTLAILDDLTEGELTGGKTVAVTGEIDDHGRVKPVGGVEQKAVAARHAGAVLMLVPSGEAEQARAHAGDMEVVAVSNLQEALVALDGLGGNALALPRAPVSGDAS